MKLQVMYTVQLTEKQQADLLASAGRDPRMGLNNKRWALRQILEESGTNTIRVATRLCATKPK